MGLVGIYGRLVGFGPCPATLFDPRYVEKCCKPFELWEEK